MYFNSMSIRLELISEVRESRSLYNAKPFRTQFNRMRMNFKHIYLTYRWDLNRHIHSDQKAVGNSYNE